MLVFGINRTGAPPEVDPANPTSYETDWNISKKLVQHLQAIEKGREACIEAQSNVAIKEALKQRLNHRREANLKAGRWIYWKYTIRSIVCEASCHPVTQSFGHSVTWSLGHLVTRSLSHSVTWTLCRLVTRSLGHSVTRSLGHYFQHYDERTNGRTTLGLPGLLRRQ